MKTNHTKKELELYGIYMIKNIITNDFYIGSTTQSFSRRFAKHKSCYKKYISENKYQSTHPILFNAYKKYRYENFEFKILKCFKYKKDSKRTSEIILYLEEKTINCLNPKYNVCKIPTKGGCPNLHKKLTDEHKQNIAKKSKLYKHSENIYDKVCKNNKENSTIYRINNEFTGSLKDCADHYNVNICTIINMCERKYKSRILKSVEKIKSQTKKIKLFINNNEIIFNSYSECDRYLDRWRGYTSTQIMNNRSVILNYKYELINEDIV